MNHSYSMQISKQLKNHSSAELRNTSKRLDQAVKFSLPDGGHILEVEHGESLREMYQHLIPIIKLPYDLMTIEFTLSANGQAEPMPFVMLLSQEENSIFCEIFYKQNGLKFWVITAFIAEIRADWDDFGILLKGRDGGFVSELEKNLSNLMVSVILNFLSALNCSNLSVSDVPVRLNSLSFKNKNKNKNKNQKKESKEQDATIYKVLVIDTDAMQNDSEALGSKGGSSKKLHLRRGHIRRLKNKMIWVNSCVVGDKKNGAIDKSYRVV